MKMTEDQAKQEIEFSYVQFINAILPRIMKNQISMGDARKELHTWWASQEADLREHWPIGEKTALKVAGICSAFQQEFVAASLKDRQQQS